MRRVAALFYQNVVLNFRQKMSLGRWWKERHRIDNWLSLYLLTSSLLIQGASRIFIRSRWVRRRDLVVRHADGMALHYPMWRYLRDPTSMLELNMTYTSYMARFANWLGGPIAFYPGDAVVDLGAHVGTFAIPALAANPGIRIVAVEPDPANMACLKRGLEASNLERSRYALEEAAVCSKPADHAVFAIGDVATRGTLAGLGFFREGKHHGQIPVRAITLEELFETHGIERCKLLKMDCEGCEYGVLKALSSGILARIDNIILEVHPVAGEDPGSFEPWLSRHGFRVNVDAQGNGCLELFCSRIDPN